MISSHLHLCLSTGLFPSGFPNSILYAVLFPPCVLHAILIASSWLHPDWWTVQVVSFLIKQYRATSCHFIPFRSMYSQYPVLEHP
jgi:hypothetical protein